MEEYATVDEAHKPYIYSKSDHFTLVLPDLTYDKGIEDDTSPVINFVPVPNGTEQDKKVLAFCYFKARKVSEIAQHLGISDSTYFRAKVLNNLEKHGYLEKSKISRVAFYKTNRDMLNIE